MPPGHPNNQQHFGIKHIQEKDLRFTQHVTFGPFSKQDTDSWRNCNCCVLLQLEIFTSFSSNVVVHDFRIWIRNLTIPEHFPNCCHLAVEKHLCIGVLKYTHVQKTHIDMLSELGQVEHAKQWPRLC